MTQPFDSFIDRLKGRQDVLGILLFGSWAKGTHRPDSDFDLLVILADGFVRTVEYSDGRAFEITYTTENKAVDYWKNNLDDCFDLWAYGKVIYDKTGVMERLAKAAADLISRGKSPLSQVVIDHLKFDAVDQLNAITALRSTDPATAQMIFYNKISGLSEIYFDLRCQWVPSPKQRLSEIRKIDDNLGALFYRAYDTNLDWQEKIVTYSEIVNKVFA
jgi:predicted nucleotidyltransferase